VLFSEPKIPQFSQARLYHNPVYVSVLFSEPKIPQSPPAAMMARDRAAFQCSSASRKFLNCSARLARACTGWVSVLFSEPKIPQSEYTSGHTTSIHSFSALQRAENSSISTRMIL